MDHLKNFLKENKLVLACSAAGLAILAICVAFICHDFFRGSHEAKIEYTDGNKHTTVIVSEDPTDESGLGAFEEDTLDIPTVESIETDEPVVDVDGFENALLVLPDDGEEHGLGLFIPADVSSPLAFKNNTLGHEYNTDNYAGAQCWDLFDVFVQNYADRRAQTCGTGAAKGMIADGCWQKNAGDEFEMVWNANDIQPGDWLVFTNGQYGHVGMAVGSVNNGYVALLGQNQGGTPAVGGGSATNIVNISLKNFGGAFRPKSYIVYIPEPDPLVPDTGIHK